MDQLSAQYVQMAGGHQSQLHKPMATVSFVHQLQAAIERSSAPRKNFLIDTTTPHGDVVITEASAMKPGIGWITLQVTEGVRKGVHEWSIKVENQGETTDGSGLMLGIVPKSFSKFDSFISQGGGWCLSRAGKFYGHWRRHDSSPSASITFGTGDRVVFTLDYDNARMTVRVGEKQIIGEVSNLTTEVYPAISLHYRHQHVRFEYHITHDRSTKQRDWMERGVLPTAAALLPLSPAQLERMPLDSYLFSTALGERPDGSAKRSRHGARAGPREGGAATEAEAPPRASGGSGSCDSLRTGEDDWEEGEDDDDSSAVSSSDEEDREPSPGCGGGPLSAVEGVRGSRKPSAKSGCASGRLPYASLEAFTARLTVVLNAFAAVRRYTEVSPATHGRFLSPHVTAEYLRKRFYESLQGSARSGAGSGAYDATLNCGAVIVIHMFAKVAGAGDNPMALPLVKSLADYLLSLPLFSLAETKLTSGGVSGGVGAERGGLLGGGSLSPEVVQLAVSNIFSLVESSLDDSGGGNAPSPAPAGAPPLPLYGALLELATLLALQRGLVHEVLRACRALLRCPHGTVSDAFLGWLQRNTNRLRPRKELPDIGKGLKTACEDLEHFYPTGISSAAAKTQVLSVAYGGDSEGACSIFVHAVDGISRWVERLGRYEQAHHTRAPDACCLGATRSSMALTLTHVFLLTDRMVAEGIAVVVYTTMLEVHRVFALSEMDASWPREGRANAQLTSGPEDQIILVYECHDQPVVHVANGAAAAAATSSAVLSAGGSIARAATRGRAAGVQVQGFFFPSFPRPSWTTALKAPTPSFDFSLTHCLALRKPCLVDLGPPDAYLQLPAGHVTVEVWLTLLDKEDATVLYQHGDKGTTGEVFMETARLEGAHCIRGGYRHAARGACVVSAPLPPTAETHFFHIALVFDGRWHLFFDGEEVACNRQGPHVSLEAPKQCWTLGNNCTCLLAGLRVWLLGKSSREIARDHKRMLAGDEPGLACQMFFNEYSGNVVFNYVASTRCRHAVCSGSFRHVTCDSHPWRSYGSGDGQGGAAPSHSAPAEGTDATPTGSRAGVSGPFAHANASASLHGDVIPPRSAIHAWADLSLTRCFCYQGQLVLVTQVSDAAPYALPSGRVFVFFDLHAGSSCSAFFYLTSRSPAQGFMGLDTAWGRVYELFDLDTDVPSSSPEGTPERKVVCLAQVPLERGAATPTGESAPSPTSASLSSFPSQPIPPAAATPRPGRSGGAAPDPLRSPLATSNGLPPLRPADTTPSHATGDASPRLPSPSADSPGRMRYDSLASWLLQLLNQYAAEEPTQEMAQLFSPLADDVGRRCSAEVQTTLNEHFRVVKGPSARRVATLTSPVSKDVIACALQILLRLIRRVRAFGLHPASVGLNVFEDAPSSAEDINRLLRELSVLSPRRRSTTTSPLSSSGTLAAIDPTQQPQLQWHHPVSNSRGLSGAERESHVQDSDALGGGTLVGLLGDIINEAGKTLPPGLGTLARTVVMEGIELFIPQVRSRAKLLRELLAIAAPPSAANSTLQSTTTISAPLLDRVPALEALVDGTVESLSTVLAAAPLLIAEESGGREGCGGRGDASCQHQRKDSVPNVLRIASDEEAEDARPVGRETGSSKVASEDAGSQRRLQEEHEDKDSLRETRGTLTVLIHESLSQLRLHFSSVENTGGAGSGDDRGSHPSNPSPSLPQTQPSPMPQRPPSPPQSAGASPLRRSTGCGRGVRATSLADAISSLQILLLSACQGLPVEQLMNAAATSQKVHNVFAMPQPCAAHRRCVRAYYDVLFQAAREGLAVLQRAAEKTRGNAHSAAENLTVVNHSFLAAPLHTAVVSIPLVMSMEEAPWFLRQLESLLPICDAAREMGRCADAVHGGAGARASPPMSTVARDDKSSSPVHVLFDAVLLSASWVATCMSRSLSASTQPATASGLGSSSTTPDDGGETVSGQEVEKLVDNPLLASGVDLSLLPEVMAAIPPERVASERRAGERRARSRRRVAAVALLVGGPKARWMDVQAKLDALGARLTSDIGDVVTLAAVTAVYLSNRREGEFEEDMPRVLKRLIPLRNHFMERRAQLGKQQFQATLADAARRCAVLLCAANPLESVSVDGDAQAQPLSQDERDCADRRSFVVARWRRTISAVRRSLHARTAGALANPALDLTHALAFVSQCVQSTVATAASMSSVLKAREQLARVRLQGLEQLLRLMEKEPSCTKSVAQLLSTTEDTVTSAPAAGTAACPTPPAVLLPRGRRASHFEAGIHGCANATRQSLRDAMDAMVEWFMAYQALRTGGANACYRVKREGYRHGSRSADEAADRLPYLCAFLRRTWWPRDLAVLRRLRFVEVLFANNCSLFPGTREGHRSSGALAVPREPSPAEQQHRATVLEYQRRVARTRGTGPAAAAGKDSAGGAGVAQGGTDDVAELNIAPTANEHAKRAALNCMKQLGLQCALALSAAGEAGEEAASPASPCMAHSRQASNFLNDFLCVLHAELRACLEYAAQLSGRPESSSRSVTDALRDQVQVLCSLLATVFKALHCDVNFGDDLGHATVSCARTLYQILASDVLISPAERRMSNEGGGDDVDTVGDGPSNRAAGLNSNGDGTAAAANGRGGSEPPRVQHVSRAAAYLRLIARMLTHCHPQTANVVFATPGMAAMCRAYCDWDAATREGATLGALFAMAVGSLQASGLNDISRAAILGLRELLCSRPRWAAQLRGLVTQFQQDIRRTALPAAAGAPRAKAAADRALLSFKAYAWSTLLGGCVLFVPCAGSRMRLRGDDRDSTGGSDAHDAFLVDVPPPAAAAGDGVAPPAGTSEAAHLEAARRASEQVVVLPTTTTVTEAMDREELEDDAFLATDAAHKLAERRGTLAETEVRVSGDNVFLPPLADSVGFAVPSYPSLADDFVAPAIDHFLRELSDGDVRGMNTVEVAALAGFTHLAFNIARETPASCQALLASRTLLAITRFANRAEPHHPLPLVFLKEFAAVALRNACDALAASAAAAASSHREGGGGDIPPSAEQGEGSGSLSQKLRAALPAPHKTAPPVGSADGAETSGLPSPPPPPGPLPSLDGMGGSVRAAASAHATHHSTANNNPSGRSSAQSSPALAASDRGGSSGTTQGPFSGSLRARRGGAGPAVPPSTSATTSFAAASHMSPFASVLPSLNAGGRGTNGAGEGVVDPHSLSSVLTRLNMPTSPGSAVERVTGGMGGTSTLSQLKKQQQQQQQPHEDVNLFPAEVPLPPLTRALCLRVAPASFSASDSDSPLPASVTIMPGSRCPWLPPGAKAAAGPSMPVWTDGITLEASVLLCDRVFPHLGEDYVIPARETMGGVVGGRPAVHFSLFSLYIRPRAGDAGHSAGPPFRLLHVFLDGDALVCQLSVPGRDPPKAAASGAASTVCRTPVTAEDWDHFLCIAVVLDENSLVLGKGGEAVSVALTPAVVEAVTRIFAVQGGRDDDTVDRLVVGSHKPPSTPASAVDSLDTPVEAPSLEECAVVLVTGVRMWGSAQHPSTIKMVADLVRRDVELPAFDQSENSCFFDFREGSGGHTCSVDGSFEAELDGQVRWVSCQFRSSPNFMDPPDKINVGSLRASPGGGNECPAAVIPRSAVAAFFAGLDDSATERVGSELLWTLVTRLARMAVAIAMERCLSVDYQLFTQKEHQADARGGAGAKCFPFDPFLLLDGSAGDVAKQLCNVFRFSDVGFLSARKAQLIRDFFQYTLGYVAHRSSASLTDGARHAEPSRETPLAAFARETREATLECLSDAREYFIIEVAAGTALRTVAASSAPAPARVSVSVMPLALLNGGVGTLHCDTRSRVYESVTVFKDRGLKSVLEKNPDNNGAWQPCSISGPNAQWVFVKSVLPGHPFGASTAQASTSSAVAICGVTVKSLQPAIARVMFGAFADYFTGAGGAGNLKQEEEDAVSALLNASFLASLVHLTDAQAPFDLRTHAVYIATTLMDLWRAHPRLKPFDHSPLHVVLAHVNAVLVGVLQRDKHGYENCGELSPTLGTYNCFTQGLFELLISGIRLEEQWLHTPHPLRIRARWERLVGLWRACTRFVPVAPASVSATTSPVSTAGTRRLSLASASTATLHDQGGTVATSSARAEAVQPLSPLGVQRGTSAAARGGAAALPHSGSSEDAANAHLPSLPQNLLRAAAGRGRTFGSISTTMGGALPPFEMHPVWPPHLGMCGTHNGGHSPVGAGACGAGMGSVNVKGNGEWLMRCDRGSMTARSTIGFTQGRFYFEVRLPERPLGNASCNALIIGLMTARSRIADTGEPIGHDGESWGFDGVQLCRMHQGCRADMSSRTRWKPGDVLGVMVDIDAGRLNLVHYERQLSAFDKLRPASVRAGDAEAAASVVYFPAVTLMAGCACEVNFGSAPFTYGMPLPLLPASPQHFCGAQATKLWSVLVAADWALACRLASGIDHGRGVAQMGPSGPRGSRRGRVEARRPEAVAPSLSSDAAFGILQRHIRESCDGRCGPLTNVDFLTSTSRLREGVDELQTDDMPCVVRGGVAVRQGKWYYEVMVRMAGPLAEGTVTVGWTVADVEGDWSAGAVTTTSGGLTVLPGKALGDDDHSWVLEGRRMIAKHNKHQISLRRHVWQDGDVVGCLLDCDAGTMRFTINGQLQREVHDSDGSGVLFRQVDALSGVGLSPAIAVDAKMSVVFLWHQDDLRYPPVGILAREEALAAAHPSRRGSSRARGDGSAGTGRSLYRALGTSSVFRDAVVEYFMGLSADGDDCCTSAEFRTIHEQLPRQGGGGAAAMSDASCAAPTPTAAQVSFLTLERVLRFVSRTTDLSPFRLPAYCLYSLLGLKSNSLGSATPRKTASAKAHPARSRRGSRRASDSASATSGPASPGQLLPERDHAHHRTVGETGGAAGDGALGDAAPSPPALSSTAAMLGLTPRQLRAAVEQLYALSAAAESLYRFGQDGRIPFDVEQVHHCMTPGPLHAALLSLRPYCLPYVGLRTLRRFLLATDGPSEPLKLIVNRRRALAAMRDTPPFIPAAQRLHNSLFGQIYSLLASKSPTLFCTNKKLWSVTFFGEGADDVGGPYRESLSQMCAELMSSDGLLPLFAPSPNQVADVGESRDVLVVSPLPGPPELLDMYRFVGRLLGGCLRGAEPLSLYLPSLVWKLFVGALPDAQDLARVDQPALNALQYVERLGDSRDDEAAEADEALSDLCPDGFTALDDANVAHELVFHGRGTPVTTRTAHAYAALAMRFKLLLATQPRLQALCEGFHQVVPLCSVSSLKWFELEELVCGQRDYDPDALLDAARFENLDPDDTRVLYLRQALKEFTRHQRALFMRFVSGRERLPAGMRLKLLADTAGDSGSPREFAPQPPTDGSGAAFNRQPPRHPSIARRDGSGTTEGGGVRPETFADARLPHASTCFYWLSLPRYSSLAVMKQRLLFAIEQCIDIDADFRVHDEDVALQEGEPQLARANVEEGDENFESFAHLR